MFMHSTSLCPFQLEEKVDSLSKEARKYQNDAEAARATISQLSLELQQVQCVEMYTMLGTPCSNCLVCGCSEYQCV